MSLAISLLIGALTLFLVVAALLLLLAALFHVRGDVAWFGMWTGGAALPHETSVRIEYGFPGFMQSWTRDPANAEGANVRDASVRDASIPETSAEQPGDIASATVSQKSATQEFSGAVGTAGRVSGAPVAEASSASERAPEHGTEHRARRSSKRTAKDPHRFRKALFHFVTDGAAWAALSGYGLRVLLRAARLPQARIDLSAGHPDPAWLGRMAGRWYAVSAVLPADRVRMNFRFQDRHPSFGVRVRGGFSLLGLLGFGIATLLTFPLLRLGWRGWLGWRRRALTGWRGRLYRKIQTIDV